MLSGGALLVAAAVLLFELRCWRVRRATGAFTRRLDEITALVEAAQMQHGQQMRGLERRLQLAERSVARAEDTAFRSASTVRWMQVEVAPRLRAAERAVGIHDVVVDLKPTQRDGDRAPEPAGQAGSS